jgi:hypothetical protein
MFHFRLIAAGIFAAALLVGCRENAGEAAVLMPQDPNGNFVLYLSNQSFAISPVDMAVYIDGTKAIQENFEVKNQHHYVAYTYRLAQGSHTIRVVSSKGGATLEKTFEIKNKHWATVFYWYYPDTRGGSAPTPRSFTFVVKDEPIGFE